LFFVYIFLFISVLNIHEVELKPAISKNHKDNLL